MTQTHFAPASQTLRHQSLKLLSIALALPVATISSTAAAQSVALTGLMGEKALLVIDNSAPKLLRKGQTHKGITLVSIHSAEQQVKVRLKDGQVLAVTVGGVPVNSGSAGVAQPRSGNRMVLHKSSDGHFFTTGYINGKAVKFIVDTGASAVSMGEKTAQKIGIDYKTKGKPAIIRTANGLAKAWSVRLKTVRVKDVTLNNVEGIVSTDMPFVLLGNSFLGRFNMQTQNEMMVLTKKY